MSRYFPLFVNLKEKKILVFGAGVIATRRILSLLEFDCRLMVVAPEASEEIRNLAKERRLIWQKRTYEPGMLKGAALVLAATNHREVNAQIQKECRSLGILVNVSSDKAQCDFYFPGLAIKDDVVIGITAGGTDHKKAKNLTEQLKQWL